MMKTKKILAIAMLGAFFAQGCFLKSIHPLVKPEDAILMDGLEGRWESEDQRWTFIHDPANFPELIDEDDFDADNDEWFLGEHDVYAILFENLQDADADTAMFMGMVSEFSGSYFLDLSVLFKSLADADVQEDFIESHFHPVHTFSRIEIKDGTLDIRFFKDDWIKGLIENNRVRIKHEKVDDDVLVTASTRELQKFLEKYGNDDNAFDDPVKMEKIQ